MRASANTVKMITVAEVRARRAIKWNECRIIYFLAPLNENNRSARKSVSKHRYLERAHLSPFSLAEYSTAQWAIIQMYRVFYKLAVGQTLSLDE